MLTPVKINAIRNQALRAGVAGDPCLLKSMSVSVKKTAARTPKNSAIQGVLMISHLASAAGENQAKPR